MIYFSIMKINVPKWLYEIAEINSQPLYLVGGYVRNALCGLPPSDVDVAGVAMPEDLILPKGFYFATTYKRMGTALIKHRYLHGAEAEYTPFRTEEYSPGGAHTPTKVCFNASVEEDARRRDFTVNSIYYDIKKDEIIDFFGGVEDAKNKILRAYDPEKVFASDGLRLLRLIRISAQTGFTIDPETERVAKASAHLLADITMARKSLELQKILFADLAFDVIDAHYRGLTLLRDYGFLPYVCPELADLDGLAQPAKYHKYDALEHTFRVVRSAPPSIRLAALFHDIGKAPCMKHDGNMHEHDVVGAKMLEKILSEEGLRLSTKEIDRTIRLVRNHMYDKERQTKSGKMLIFVAKNFDIIDDLSELMDADSLGKGTVLTAEPNRLKEFRDILVQSGAPIRQCDLHISGVDLISLGYEGEEIGKELNRLYETCVLNPSLNNHKKLLELSKRGKINRKTE